MAFAESELVDKTTGGNERNVSDYDVELSPQPICPHQSAAFADGRVVQGSKRRNSWPDGPPRLCRPPRAHGEFELFLHGAQSLLCARAVGANQQGTRDVEAAPPGMDGAFGPRTDGRSARRATDAPEGGRGRTHSAPSDIDPDAEPRLLRRKLL